MIENTFGVLTSRWRILRKPICAKVETIDVILMATVCLHNYLRKNDANNNYCPPTYVDRDENGIEIPGDWRNEGLGYLFGDVRNTGACRAVTVVYEVRDRLAHYFSTPAGQVPWQIEYIRRGFHN